MSPIESAGVLLSASGVFLETQRVIFCWPINNYGGWLLFLHIGDQHLYAMQRFSSFSSACPFMDDNVAEKAVCRIRFNAGTTMVHDAMLRHAFAGVSLGLALSRWTSDPAPYADAMLKLPASGNLLDGASSPAAWLVWIVTNGAYVVLFLPEAWRPRPRSMVASCCFLYGWFIWALIVTSAT